MIKAYINEIQHDSPAHLLSSVDNRCNTLSNEVIVDSQRLVQQTETLTECIHFHLCFVSFFVLISFLFLITKS